MPSLHLYTFFVCLFLFILVTNSFGILSLATENSLVGGSIDCKPILRFTIYGGCSYCSPFFQTFFFVIPGLLHVYL